MDLVADIGATNARFGLLDPAGDIVTSEILACTDYPGLAEAAESFIAHHTRSDNRPTAGAFAVAGPVRGDQISLTNHPWSFSITATRDRLRLGHLDVINDFAAQALAIPRLESTDLVSLSATPRAERETVAIIGPGTGLGVAGLVPAGDRHWVAIAGEGGHVTMPAYTACEDRIVQRLRARFDHVSAERILSGQGLQNLYWALSDLEADTDVEPDRPSPTPAQITDRAMARTDRLAETAVDLFTRWLGTVAGNLVLTFGATGGLFIAGGIVPRLGPRFDAETFFSGFLNKGRFARYLETVPAFVVTHPLPAFLGLHVQLDQALGRHLRQP